MPSEKLASGENLLKGELAAAWNILEGSSGDYTDLGIARRFGGAAAAYSLRDIGAMNGRVVKVRRDLAGEEADPEEDFSASQVQSGALEDWVNGKLESTLPADVATAAAAYSLRKVKDGYSGNAVRIRRSSDDIEVDVAFDSNDKVSASSAITNVAEQGGESGSTTATDLNGFLTEQSFFYKQEDNTSSSSYSLSRNSSRWNFSKVSSVSDGTTTKTGEILKLEATGTNGTFLLFTNPEVGCTNHETTITFDYLFPSSNSDTDIYVNVNDSASTSASSPTVTPNDINGSVSGTWTTASHTFSSSSSGQIAIRLTNSPTSTIGASVTPDAGDEFYITNLKVSTVKADAFVHTWYDQAGSNNAVQATATYQPKIAENGALLADGLKFDGSDDMLTNSNVGAMQASDGMSSFTVHKKRVASTSTLFGGTNPQYLYHLYETSLDTSVLAHRILGGELGILRANAAADDFLITRTTNHLIGTTKNLSSAIGSSGFQNFYNATIPAEDVENTGTSYDSSSTKLSIGSQSGGAGDGRHYDGQIEELILYTSDQSDNRFKIESNINNYYDLYNDANDLAGNFTVDSSGSGTDASISNESKTGFTATVVDKAGFFGADLNEAVPNGSNLYISFTANLSPSGGTAATPNFGLANSADKTGNSTGNPLDTAVTEGFNSITVAGTASTCDRIRFTEGNDNVSFIISDLKVSRIARNGFVPTWYDQSGNFRPLIQTNASEQPIIVENGSFLGAIKAEVATSNDTMQNLQVSTDGTNANFGTDDWANGGTKLGLMYVGSVISAASPSSTSVLWGGGRGVSSFQSGGLSIQFIKAGTDSFRLRNERQGLSPSGTTVTLSGEVTGDAIIYGTADNRDFKIKVNDNSATDTEDADLDVREAAALSLFGAYAGDNSRYYQRSASGNCKECYLFSGDNITEVDTIATEINQHYNIYS